EHNLVAPVLAETDPGPYCDCHASNRNRKSDVSDEERLRKDTSPQKADSCPPRKKQRERNAKQKNAKYSIQWRFAGLSGFSSSRSDQPVNSERAPCPLKHAEQLRITHA